jgi:uncharacterized protein (TIGR03083 family)
VATTDDLSRQLVMAAARRTGEIVERLREQPDEALNAPSQLPGWSCLTIACHLRYGAEALGRMTGAALRGEPAAYYPGGRALVRASTLVPLPDERPADVVASLAQRSDELHQLWSSLDAGSWSIDVVEPADNPDLGPVPLARLPLLRLTEVDVHGSDLGLGLGDWSHLFVRAALPMRLDWLNRRRAPHRDFDTTLDGSWLLVATDGPTYRVRVRGTEVESRPSHPTDDENVRATIAGTSRDLLALLLGRPPLTPAVITGDQAFGAAFSDAFPGP